MPEFNVPGGIMSMSQINYPPRLAESSKMQQ